MAVTPKTVAHGYAGTTAYASAAAFADVPDGRNWSDAVLHLYNENAAQQTVLVAMSTPLDAHAARFLFKRYVLAQHETAEPSLGHMAADERVYIQTTTASALACRIETPEVA